MVEVYCIITDLLFCSNQPSLDFEKPIYTFSQDSLSTWVFKTFSLIKNNLLSYYLSLLVQTLYWSLYTSTMSSVDGREGVRLRTRWDEYGMQR